MSTLNKSSAGGELWCNRPAITLGSQRPRESLPEFALLVVAAIAGLIAIAATIYVCYRFAEGTVERSAARHKCLSAAVGVHPALHRHRHLVERHSALIHAAG